MGSELIPLGDLCSKVLTGGTPLTKNKHFYEGGDIPWLKTKEVNFNFIQETENFITQEGLDGSSAKLVPINSVIVAMYGQGDTAGRVAINKVPVTTNQACCNLVIDPKKADFRYVYYYLKHSYAELVRRKTGSAQPNLNTRILKEFEILNLPLEEQTSIGKLLEKFDLKIILNSKINQTLEQMAQTLFKSWFVDFDPVIDNALDAGSDIPEVFKVRVERRKAVRESADFKPLPDDVRQLFPSEFEESELGWVPKGWQVTRLENILELAYGKALKKTVRVEGDYPVYGSGGINGTHNKALIQGPGIIVGRKGTVGSLFWESNDFFPIDTVYYVKPKRGYSLSYCYYLLKTLGLDGMNTDAAVPGLNRNNAYRLECIVPADGVLQELTDILVNFRKKMNHCSSEEKSLIEMRDALLPKLISGEISLGGEM